MNIRELEIFIDHIYKMLLHLSTQSLLAFKGEMEETSRFYRRIRRIQMSVLRLAGLVAFENHTLAFAGTIFMSIYVNLAFTAVSSVYIWAFIDDCLNRRFNPDITSELFSFFGFHLRFLYMFSRRKKLGRLLRYVIWNSNFVTFLRDGFYPRKLRFAILYFSKLFRIGY